MRPHCCGYQMGTALLTEPLISTGIPSILFVRSVSIIVQVSKGAPTFCPCRWHNIHTARPLASRRPIRLSKNNPNPFQDISRRTAATIPAANPDDKSAERNFLHHTTWQSTQPSEHAGRRRRLWATTLYSSWPTTRGHGLTVWFRLSAGGMRSHIPKVGPTTLQ